MQLTDVQKGINNVIERFGDKGKLIVFDPQGRQREVGDDKDIRVLVEESTGNIIITMYK